MKGLKERNYICKPIYVKKHLTKFNNLLRIKKRKSKLLYGKVGKEQIFFFFMMKIFHTTTQGKPHTKGYFLYIMNRNVCYSLTYSIIF